MVVAIAEGEESYGSRIEIAVGRTHRRWRYGVREGQVVCSRANV